MARPTKQGIDFFSLDVNDDDKLDLFIAESGAEGFGILVILWRMIYRGEGYYIHHDDDLILMLRRKTLSASDTIVSAVENAVKRGIFDEKMLRQFGILTSRGIQKRFFPAASKKKEVHVTHDFLLISVSGYNNVVFDSGNPVSNDGNATKEKEKGEEEEEEGVSYETIPHNRVSGSENPVAADGNAPAEKEKGRKKKKDGASYETLSQNFQRSSFRDESIRFAEWFARELKPGTVKGTPSEKAKWAMIWYHLRETDSRANVAEMGQAIAWARGEPFWSTNFMTPMKLRIKDKQGIMYIDRFLAQYRKHKNGVTNGNGKHSITPTEFGDILDWINSNATIPA